MKKQISIYIALFVFISSIAFAGAPINEINALIDAHGKKNVANFIKEKSDNGSVTVEIDGQLVVKLGKPAIDYVTAKSIQSDFTRLGITIEQAKAGIVGANDDKAVKKYVVNEGGKEPDPALAPVKLSQAQIDHDVAWANKCAAEDNAKNQANRDAQYNESQARFAAQSAEASTSANPYTNFKGTSVHTGPQPWSPVPQYPQPTMNNSTAVPAPAPAINMPQEVHVNPDMPFFPNH